MRTFLACSAALFLVSCAVPADDPSSPQLSALADANIPPTAEVITDCGYMYCTFVGVLDGNDPDGTIVACEYLIGGNTSPYCSLYYEWTTPGTKTIQFSVWDDVGAVGTTTFDVEARESPITVSSQHTRVKKQDYITVSWSGAQGNTVRLVRSGGDPAVYTNPLEIFLPNTGEWVDVLEAKCIGFTYTIWEVDGNEYSYPSHRSRCEKGKGKPGGGKK